MFKSGINTVINISDHEQSMMPWLQNYPSQVNWFESIPGQRVEAMLQASAQNFPQNIAIDFLDKQYTYRDVDDLSNRIALGLQQQGVKKGTKIGLFMPNTPFFILFYYGILKAGGIVVNFNPLYVVQEIINQIQDSGTDMIVTLDLAVLYHKLKDLPQKTCLKKLIICPLRLSLPFPQNILFPILKSKEIAPIDWNDHTIHYKSLINNSGYYQHSTDHPDDTVAVLQYTGGTTGLPKGALLTHSNVSINAQQSALWFYDAKPGRECVLAALPFFHVFAMTAVMNLGIKLGAKIVIMFPRFNVTTAMKLIERKQVTFFPAVPTIYHLINHHQDITKYKLDSIKGCISGGAPLSAEIKRLFETKTGCSMVEGYGLSETSPVSIVNPLKSDYKQGSIGMPLPSTMVKIMSLDDPTQEMPFGDKGEVCIKGPQVMQGYWKRPEETALALRDGYLHTGDVGYIDQDGFIFLVDRIKDLIISNGYNVYPRYIEEAIMTHRAVAEVSVIGIHDTAKGEVPKAFVKLKENQVLNADELKSFLQNKLSPLSLPRLIEFRDTLPKTLIGKLSKKELIEEERLKRTAQ